MFNRVLILLFLLDWYWQDFYFSILILAWEGVFFAHIDAQMPPDLVGFLVPA